MFMEPWMLWMLGIILMFAVFFVPIQVLKEPFKIGKKYVAIFLIINRVILLAVVIHNIYFQILGIVIFLLMAIIECLFIWLVSKTENGKLFALTGFFLTFLCCSAFITTANRIRYYEHAVIYDYEITIKDEEVITNYDETCSEVRRIVNEAVDNMKKWNSTCYQGSVKVVYECKYPARYHSHDTECKCTDREICDVCREYTGKVKYVYEIQG